MLDQKKINKQVLLGIRELILQKKKISITSLKEITKVGNQEKIKIALNVIGFDLKDNQYYILHDNLFNIIKYLDSIILSIESKCSNIINVNDLKLNNLSQYTDLNHLQLSSLIKSYKDKAIVKKFNSRIEQIKKYPKYFCKDCKSSLVAQYWRINYCPTCEEREVELFIDRVNIIYDEIIDTYSTTGKINNQNEYTIHLMIEKHYQGGFKERFNKILLSKKENSNYQELIFKSKKILDFKDNKCLKCGYIKNISQVNKGYCPGCVKKDPENNKIKCSNCNKYKIIFEYPKDLNMILKHKTQICRDCDKAIYLDMRRDVSYKYSITEKGKANQKKHLKIYQENMLCRGLGESLSNYYKTDIKLSSTKFNYIKVFNNNKDAYKKIGNPYKLTLKEFFEIKRDNKMQFDHIIPRKEGNIILYEYLKEEVELLISKGYKKSIIDVVSKILNDESNIQLISFEENQIKKNNILEKDRDLHESIKKKLIQSINDLYDNILEDED